jgi:hypothetical protein
VIEKIGAEISILSKNLLFQHLGIMKLTTTKKAIGLKSYFFLLVKKKFKLKKKVRNRMPISCDLKPFIYLRFQLHLFRFSFEDEPVVLKNPILETTLKRNPRIPTFVCKKKTLDFGISSVLGRFI